MKFLSLVCLSAALLWLGGCEKYAGRTEVSGRVVDHHTQQPVAGAYVLAVGSSSSWAGGSSTSRATTADALGRFAFSFEADAGAQYQVGTSTGSGYTNQGDGPLIYGGRKNDNLVVAADAPAWVRVNCVDDPPYGIVNLETRGYLDGPNGQQVDYQYIDAGNFLYIRSILSYTDQPVYWEVTDLQGNNTKGRIPYTTTGFDTTTVTIHF